MPLTDHQLWSISIASRTAASLSLLGTAVVWAAFLTSNRFRKPINRLVFYATIGNVVADLVTLIGRNGIILGVDTPLCQFQAFVDQWVMAADSLWTLVMALNVYLTIIHKYSPSDLRRLEKYYGVACYGVPFVPAFTFLFVRSDARGHVYGNATIWCWISTEWDVLRVACFYAPIWLIIITIISLYIRVGVEVRRRRIALRAFRTKPSPWVSSPQIEADPTGWVSSSQVNCPDDQKTSGRTDGQNTFMGLKTIEVQVSSQSRKGSYPGTAGSTGASQQPREPHSFETPHSAGEPGSRQATTLEGKAAPSAYSITISSKKAPGARYLMPFIPASHPSSGPATQQTSTLYSYVLTSILFFVVIVITWVPSSLNRLYALIHPDWPPSYALNLAASIVLPLQGFWNAVIFTALSWRGWKRDRQRARANASAAGRHNPARRPVTGLPLASGGESVVELRK